MPLARETPSHVLRIEQPMPLKGTTQRFQAMSPDAACIHALKTAITLGAPVGLHCVFDQHCEVVQRHLLLGLSPDRLFQIVIQTLTQISGALMPLPVTEGDSHLKQD